MAALFRLVHAKWNPPASPEVSFADKTVLITGANTGYGFEAAKHFLALDAARLIIGARSLERGNAARERLQHEFPDKRDLIDVLPLDLNSYKSVTGFAKLVDTNYRNLDVAILNAGVSNREYTVSPEGWEETLQINTLSTVLLALLLLPKMKASKRDQANVHMVIVSSELYTSVTAEEIGAGSDNILKACSDTKDRFAAGGGLRQYSISKLLVMYATKKLASSVSSPEGESQVLVTSCCPGAAITDLGRQYNRWYERMGVQLFGLLLTRTVEEGSRTLVSAATLGAESHGGYWKNDQLKPVGGLMASEECKDLQDQVWGEILEALKSKVPEVEQLAIRS